MVNNTNNENFNERPRTIKFNVGGKHFEVSRDLIMKDGDASTDNNEHTSSATTMLSRLVSDTWLENPESEVFIDRDGDIFSYILNYLRYGEVVLPHNMPKEGFLRDLDFYGIPIEEGVIRKENSFVSKPLKDIVDAAREKEHMIICLGLIKDYTEHSRDVFKGIIVNDRNYCREICGKTVCIYDYEEKVLNRCLAKFGFKIIEWRSVHNSDPCCLTVLE